MSGRDWVEHLRAGGTTGWAEYAAAHPGGSGAGQQDQETLPGAQQLELLRRLHLVRAARGGRPDPRWADEVLTVTASGRASLDLPLVGLPSRGYGAAPVDPATLPADALLPVATGLVADRLAALELAPRHGPTRWDRAREEAREQLPRRRPFRLVGPTGRVDPVRERVRELGRTPGGRGAVHHVLGADVDRLVTDAWTSRVMEGTAPPWADWLRGWVDRDTCPPRADLATIADGWAARRGADRVTVVLDVAELRTELALSGPVGAAPPPPAAATELVRQVSSVLGVMVDRPRRARLLTERLAPRLGDADGPPLVVPPRHRAWLLRQGRTLDARIREGGYRVLGPSALLEHPPRTDGAAAPDPDEVLRLALACLDAWSDEGPEPARHVGRRVREESG